MAKERSLDDFWSAENSPRDLVLDHKRLECPVCNTPLQRPRRLPCYHSFCQKCLQGYINDHLSNTRTSEKCFPCPACKEFVYPVGSESHELWAENFPMDDQIAQFIQLRENVGEPYHCNKKHGIAVPGSIWCKTCNILLCDACKVNYHDMILYKCDLVRIREKTTAHAIHNSEHLCLQHSESTDYFCEDHQILGCSKCMTLDHRRCEMVTLAEKYCEKLIKSSRFTEIRTTLRKGEDVMDVLIEKFSEHLQSLTKDKEYVLKSIAELKEKFLTFLEIVQKEKVDDLMDIYSTETGNILEMMEKCKRLKTEMHNTQELSDEVSAENSYIDIILMYLKGEADIESGKTFVKELVEAFSFMCIKHMIDKDFAKPGEDRSFPFGRVVLEKQQKRLPRFVNFENVLLSKRSANELRSFSIKCPSDLSDCGAFGIVYLPDNLIVISDYWNNKLKLFTDDGEYLDELKVFGDPWDLCIVNSSTVGVAVTNPNAIHVIKIEGFRLSMSTSLELNQCDSCYGITYADGKYIVGTWSGICSVKTDGNSEVLHQSVDRCYHLRHDQIHGETFATSPRTSPGAVSVFRLSPDNTLDEIAKTDVVTSAFGMDLDREGNIYVCSRDSSKVIQMSRDGTNVRSLLTSSDAPRAIAVCGDNFVITNETYSKNRNRISVYQLV